MPRPADPQLEEQILAAAHKLWKKGGEKALTMRAVAKAAGTNTPSVYRRFSNRQDIVKGLVRRVQAELGALLRPCHRVEEIGEVFLEYALSHPREFELVISFPQDFAANGRNGRPVPMQEIRPNLWLVQQRLAEQFGGVASDYGQLGLGLAALANGTALFLIHGFLPGHESQVRSAFRAATKIMLRGTREKVSS